MIQNQFIIGLNTLTEVIKQCPQQIIQVFAQRAKEKGRKSDLLELCQKKRIPITFVSFDKITQMVDSDSHQGFAAHIQKRSYTPLKDFLRKTEDKPKSITLMLDQVFDPQNVGAILRSAECFGVDAVVFSKNRGTAITPVVTKTSCGASELMPLIRVSNLAEAVTQFQDEGFTAVTSLLNPESINLFEYTFSDKTLIIVGSEGEGIQKLIQKRANHSIYIPMQGHIQSLNVAQATSVLLYAARSQLI